MAHGKEIDLILMDSVMPGLSGVEAGVKIRAILPNIKILFSSGYSRVDLPEELQGTQVLQKPYLPSELYEAIRNALDKVEA